MTHHLTISGSTIRWPCRLFLNAKRTTQIGTLTKLVRFEDIARDGILKRDAQGSQLCSILVMASGTQIHMVMRDMLFINWAVDPDAARKFVDSRLELDTVVDSAGKSMAFASAVCFRVDEVRSSVLPLPRLSFEQVNCRIYVKAEDVPAVVFIDMKVNSRMVTTLTSFLRVPVSYEDIEIKVKPDGADALRYVFESSGLHADVTVGGEAPLPNPAIEPPFITQRLAGYAGAGDSMYRIDVQHPLLDARPARVAGAEASTLVGLGLFTVEESRRPHSALYVREALFGTSPPTRAW